MNMDSITIWEKKIKERVSSGLKVADWCEQNQVSRHAYYYWHQKIKERKAETHTQPLFAELLPDSKQVVQPAVFSISWKDVTIHVPDRNAINLAAEMLLHLRQQC